MRLVLGCRLSPLVTTAWYMFPEETSTSTSSKGIMLIIYRQFKHFNSVNFRAEVLVKPWDDNKEFYDPNNMCMWRKWKNLFLTVCERHAPMKTKRTRNSKAAWITTILKKRMNYRDRLKRKAIKTNDPSIWNQFRMVRNQVNQEIKIAKQAYYKNAFSNCSGDQRKTWKIINELTARRSNKTVINEIEYNGLNRCSRNAKFFFFYGYWTKSQWTCNGSW